MKIGGMQKVCGIDFPGKLATVIFTQGCNFRCQFCHNGMLVVPLQYQDTLDENYVFDFLKSRQGKIEGVVISGGEPTLQPDLAEFFYKIRELGFATKLDTNGTNPQMLEKLYNDNLLDYVAMDIKHELDKYPSIVLTSVNLNNIKSSIGIIRESGIDYEFRTTVVPMYHSPENIRNIACELAGSKRYILQEFNDKHSLNKNLTNNDSIFLPQNREILEDVLAFCRSKIDEVTIRAL